MELSSEPFENVSWPTEDEDDEEMSEAKRRRESEFRLKQRHYKKDSRFLLDLYTLTFDEDQTIEEIETCKTRIVSTADNDYVRCQTPPVTPTNSKLTGARGRSSLSERGPMSLDHFSSSSPKIIHRATRSGSIPSLETNLLKILARKIQDSEEISFRKAKLLTKAYYRMLRSNGDAFEKHLPVQFPEYSSLVETSSDTFSHQHPQTYPNPPGINRLSWQKLIRSSNADLQRMVGGLENTAKVLNEYLVDLLLEKDELLSSQDQMLEEISELTDQLLILG